MSISGAMRERDRGASAGMQAGQFVGLRTAPSYITKSPAERYMSEYSADHRGVAEPPSPASLIEREITKALRAGDYDRAQSAMEKGIEAGTIGNKEILRAQKNAEEDALAGQFLRLPLGPAVQAFTLMNADERQRTEALLYNKMDPPSHKGGFDALPQAEQDRLMAKMERAGLFH
jgi:hypothetical protein